MNYNSPDGIDESQYKLPNHWIHKEDLPEQSEVELEACEICLNEIPGNANSYKFHSTNFNKNVICGCYDCYVFELENKLKPL